MTSPRIVCPLHWHHDPARLERVLAIMRERGAPTLRGFVDAEWSLVLLSEGTHRIRAAALLELVPTIVAIPWWRTKEALARARFAAAHRGYRFAAVHLDESGLRR